MCRAQIETPIESALELSEVTVGVLGVVGELEGMTGAGLPCRGWLSTVLSARNCGSSAVALPPIVTMRLWVPARSVAMKRARSSQAVVTGRTRDLAAKSATASLVKGSQFGRPVFGGL